MRKIRRLGFSLEDKKVLEVGFGWGGFKNRLSMAKGERPEIFAAKFEAVDFNG